MVLNKDLMSLLEVTGANQGIYTAMDSDDLADVVRAATVALTATNFLPISEPIKYEKSVEESKRLRSQGKAHYANGEYKEAITCYNKALAFAPPDSPQLSKAYGNISTVMLVIKAYQACQMNINACLDTNPSKHLREKLTKRMKETYKFINGEMMRDVMLRSDKTLFEYMEFDVARNAEIPCAREEVGVQEESKKAVASGDIAAGAMVAMERAFVSIQDERHQYTSCYHCHRISLFLMPCDGCSRALFCTKECKQKCMEDYHRIECRIDAYSGTLYEDPVSELAAKAAIKMSLKLSWEELRVASLDMGLDRLKKSSVKEAFDSDNPLSMLCYDDQRTFFHGKIFNGSIICAAILHRLRRIPDYLPDEPSEREKAVDALSRIMLHLYATFNHRIIILCSTYDFQEPKYKCGVQRNTGWFSFASKLAHSCEPNLFAVGLNDKVALVALRPIKKGEELTISYIDHFYDFLTIHRCAEHSLHRQKQIFNAIQQRCECRVCLLEWDSSSHVQGKLTKRQTEDYNRLMAKSGSFGDRLKAASAALDSLADLINTTQHKEVYNELRLVLHICQCFTPFNKGIPCRDCDEVLPNKTALYKHRRKEHSDSTQEPIDAADTSLGESGSGVAWRSRRLPPRPRAKPPPRVAVIEMHSLNPSTEEVMGVLEMNNICYDQIIEVNLMSFLKGTTNLVPNCARALSILSDVPKTQVQCVKPQETTSVNPVEYTPYQVSVPATRPEILQRLDNAYHPQTVDERAQNIQDLNVQLLQDGVVVNSDQIQLDLNDLK